MAYKNLALDEQTFVTIYKRRGSRYLRLSIAASGKIRVTIPTWTPYRVGLEFARSRKGWIISNKPQPQALLQHGQAIGKAHRLHFINTAGLRVSSSVRGNQVVIRHPAGMPPEASKVQQAASRAAIKALKLQAEQLLPQRLQQLADRHNFKYQSIQIKQLKSRWGSCDSRGNIVLSLFLMQLPWECIDYVLLHELTHTRLLRHGPDFWQAMEKVLPDVKRLRKTIRQFRPVLEAKIS